MIHTLSDTEWIAVLESERARLSRLCTRITRDRDAAEDLVQETLIEAWLHRRRLRNPDVYAAWLSGIARNVCRRWARQRGRELTLIHRVQQSEDAPYSGIEFSTLDDLDIEMELERDELAELLDRALTLLPASVRQVLIARYIEESPRAHIAERLGLSEGAVAMRLNRGKLALRQVIINDFRHEAASYGLVICNASEWKETRIWCPICGSHTLVGRFVPAAGDLTLRCEHCAKLGMNVANVWSLDFLRDLKSFKPALNRIMAWGYAYYESARQSGRIPCYRCGRQAQLRCCLPVDSPMGDLHGVHIACDACGAIFDISLQGLALWRPEGRRFWREHPKIQALPDREVEVGGRAVLVTTFESVTERESLDVLFARDTYEVINTFGSHGN